MPHHAFIGIGTNLGHRPTNYRGAIERISRLPTTRLVKQSSCYETEPVGDISGRFLNGVVEVETELSAQALMNHLLHAERLMGRKRPKPGKGRSRSGPVARVIDLDLLLFDNEVIRGPSLTVPHPRLHERRFVLAPLSELAPSLVHPVLNATVSELLAALKPGPRVTLAHADLLRSARPQRQEVASR